MGSPWTAPAWMKDNGRHRPGLAASREYYAAYAQYFVKYIQAYQAQGVHVDYVSAQNEPTLLRHRRLLPVDEWNALRAGRLHQEQPLPALHAAGLTTKVLVHDWNWDGYADFGPRRCWPTPRIRNDPLFGGIAWHGYGGDVAPADHGAQPVPGA